MPERFLGATLGKFRVDAVVGSGGFAWVYKGWDPELEIPVALKVLKPQYGGDETFEARFRREAATAARLRHPNIVKIYAVGRDGPAVYFAMDYLPQGLADRLEVMATLPPEMLIRLGMDVASALDFAHREGVIHRDIKTDNILFDAHGNAIVADFGIARAVQNYAAQTGTNMVVGTPQYFSPEQARGLSLDGRADIYSLGITLFRAATGVLPFNGDDWYEIARQHVDDPPPTPSSLNPALPAELDAIILKCLAKSPDDRYATGDELCEAFAELARTQAGTSATRAAYVRRTGVSNAATVRSHAWRRAPKKGVIAAGAASLVMLAAAAALFMSRGSAVPGVVAPDTASAAPRPADTLAAAVPDSDDQSEEEEPPNAAARLGPPILRIRAPAAALIRVDGTSLGRAGREGLRVDTLPSGRHIVHAELVGAPGCSWSRARQTVELDSGRVSYLTLTPRLCGTIRLDVGPQTVESSYALQAVGGAGPTMRGLARRMTPVLVPVGRYAVVVRAPSCQSWTDTLEVSEGGQQLQRRVRLLCPLEEQR